MSFGLQDFLNENLTEGITADVVVSNRFKDKEGNVFKFKIKAQDADSFADAQKAATAINRKTKDVSVDQIKLMVKTVVDCTIEPNFRDAASIKKTGCTNAEQYLNKVLLVGEISNLYNEISKLSGFEPMQDLVDEAKN